MIRTIDINKHQITTEMEDLMYELGYKKGKTDAIDEFAKKLVQWKPQNEDYMIFRDVVFQIAEQLKENR